MSHLRRAVYWRLKRLDSRTRSLDKQFKNLRRRFYCELWHSSAAAVGATAHELSDGYLRIARDKVNLLARGDQIGVDSQVFVQFTGNKHAINEYLRQRELPVPRYLRVHEGELGRAFEFLSAFGAPIVAKPARDSGGGEGVITGISTRSELRRAISEVTRLTDAVLLEEQQHGSNYRALVLDGEVIDLICRMPPAVIGDGESTIRDLVNTENRRRLEKPVIALSPLMLDTEMLSFLKRRGSSSSAVPDAGKMVPLKNVVNQNSSRENIRVPLASVHPDVLAICRDAVGGLGRLVGVDLYCLDPSLSPEQGRLVIGELNANPGLHHHVLVSEDSQPLAVAEQLLRTLIERPRQSAIWQKVRS